MESPTNARASIAVNAATLHGLEAHVEALHRAGDDWGACAWAQVAAEHAMRNHPGRFAFPRLERVLAQIGATLPPLRGPRPALVRRVLHVLTEGYDTGGHTRLAWRWMQRDTGRRHELCLTRPGPPVPPSLSDAAAAVHVLHPGAPFARAAELRTLAADFDCVVLHVHMHDAVPVIAFAGRDPQAPGPAVVFVDHADHLPWLGVATADVATACRAPVHDVHAQRRGIARERSVLLPVPTDDLPPLPDAAARAAARAQLELSPEAEVLLTVATAHKVAGAVRPSYPDAVGAVLAARPAAMLVFVGAEPHDDGVAQLHTAFGGRVRAMGRRSDLAPYWAAADVYLDSHPFSSNTSAIEAASNGLPVVSFAPDPAQQGLLLTHDPGFEDVLLRAATPADYVRVVDRALAERDALVPALRAGAQAAHCGAGWQRHLEEVYATALAAGPAPVPADLPPGEVVSAWEVVHHQLFAASRMTGPIAASLLAQADGFAPGAVPFTAVAAPQVDPAAIARAVGELRALHRARVLDRSVVAIAPQQLDAAVPLLEQALAAGGDFPLDLVATDDPRTAAAGRVLEVS